MRFTFYGLESAAKTANPPSTTSSLSLFHEERLQGSAAIHLLSATLLLFAILSGILTPFKNAQSIFNRGRMPK